MKGKIKTHQETLKKGGILHLTTDVKNLNLKNLPSNAQAILMILPILFQAA